MPIMMALPSAFRSPIRKVGTLFANRRIGTKIGIGFACVLAITVAISAISYIVFAKAGDGVAKYEQSVEVVAIARDIDRGFVGFRRNAGEYLNTGQEKYIGDAEQQRTTVADGIAHGLEIIKNPERLAKLKELSQQFDSYSQDFRNAEALKREQVKLIAEKLDVTGMTLFSAIDRLQQGFAARENSTAMIVGGEAMKHLLLARLNVNKLLARYDESTAEAAAQAFVDLSKVLGALDSGLGDDAGARKLLGEIKGFREHL
jgi:CHASE3 domain sensor protein